MKPMLPLQALHRSMRAFLPLLLLASLGAAPPRPKASNRAGLVYIYTYYDRNGGTVVNNFPPTYGPNQKYILKHVGVGRPMSVLTPAERTEVFRSPEFIALADRISEREGVDPHLTRAVIQAESAFNYKARSHAGALGLMQLMPATAQRFGVTDVFDPEQNINGGVKYLRWLMDFFKNDLEKVVAAYNSGERNVEKWRGIPPFAETRAYVPKVLSLFKSRSVQPDSRFAGKMANLKKGRGGFTIQEENVRSQVDPKPKGTVTLAKSPAPPTRIYAWRDKAGILNLTDYPPPDGIKEIRVDQD